MSQRVDLSAIKAAIDNALEAIDTYLDREQTPNALEADTEYAKKLKSVLEGMGSTVEQECGNPNFRPTLEEGS